LKASAGDQANEQIKGVCSVGSAIIKSPISSFTTHHFTYGEIGFLTAHHFMYGEIDNRQIKALDVRKFVGCAPA
jgi:hypothetical protein